MLDVASAAALFNSPMAMRPSALDALLATLSQRLALSESLSHKPTAKSPVRAMLNEIASHGYSGATRDDGVVVLTIVGALTRRATWLTDAMGFITYDEITSAIVSLAINDSVDGILLDIDSPGGEAGGSFDAAELIRKTSVQTGKPIWAIANEDACSAAYALASGANQIWLTRTAEVGSIGIVASHIDRSGLDAAKGLKWTHVYAGANKTALDPHAPLADSARAKVQRDVDRIYEMFVSLVSKHRGMTPEAVRATKADTFMGKAAIKAGLADRIGTLEECRRAFAASLGD